MLFHAGIEVQTGISKLCGEIYVLKRPFARQVAFDSAQLCVQGGINLHRQRRLERDDILDQHDVALCAQAEADLRNRLVIQVQYDVQCGQPDVEHLRQRHRQRVQSEANVL